MLSRNIILGRLFVAFCHEVESQALISRNDATKVTAILWKKGCFYSSFVAEIVRNQGGSKRVCTRVYVSSNCTVQFVPFVVLLILPRTAVY